VKKGEVKVVSVKEVAEMTMEAVENTATELAFSVEAAATQRW
jgi:hypothetical protein